MIVLRGLVVAAVLAAPSYTPPVDAPLTDRFRPPATRYGAGNRGVDYDTAPGATVRAAGEGVVVFAGSVGATRHVVVAHADGVRTTYAFLAQVTVRRGQRVASGDAVGVAGEHLHFGARLGDEYVDPEGLFGGGGGGHARLVDDDGLAPPSLAAERRLLVDLVRDAAVAPGVGDPVRRQWAADQDGCTDAAVDPPRPSGRRLVMLVGGLGSATDRAAIRAVDTGALGYASDDVVLFSYRVDGAHPYTAGDTQRSISSSAALLADQVAALRRRAPGVPVDVLAHSQGGLVARAALAAGGLAGVDTIVTFGTPHGGNGLAAAGGAIDDATATGAAAFDLAARLRLAGIDPTSASVRDLAAGSTFLDALASAPPPPAGVRVVAVAASTDAVVPAGAARWPGAANVLVDLAGRPTAVDHARLPGDPAATREAALAITGRGPTCVGFGEWRARRAAGRAFAVAHDVVGRALAGAVAWVDERVRAGRGEVMRR